MDRDFPYCWKGGDSADMKLHLRRVFLLFILCSVLVSCAGAHSKRLDTDIIYPEHELPEPKFLESDTEAATDPVLPTEITEPPTEPITEPLTEPPTEPQTEALTEPPAEPLPSHVTTAKFTNRPADEVIGELEALGLTVETRSVVSSTPAGRVKQVNFHGEVLEDCYVISTSHPVILTVSLGRAERRNVQAKDSKTVYLTFDDGPGPYTSDILATLERYNVRAAFFMVGEYAAANPERVKAVYDAGHLIGCHSYSHDYVSLYASADSLLAELSRWEDCMKSALGFVPEEKLFRFPGGTNMHLLTRSMADTLILPLHDRGYRCFDWTLADNDRYLQGKPAEQSITDYLKASVKATLALVNLQPERPKIMLMHDASEETAEVLPWIIEYLQGEGYTFSTLDTLDGDWTFY